MKCIIVLGLMCFTLSGCIETFAMNMAEQFVPEVVGSAIGRPDNSATAVPPGCREGIKNGVYVAVCD